MEHVRPPHRLARVWLNLPLFLLGGPFTYFIKDRTYLVEVNVHTTIWDIDPILQQQSKVLEFDSLTDTTPDIFADLRPQVHNFWDRGLLGMALDPNFATNPYVYVLYSCDADINGTFPKYGTTTSRQPSTDSQVTLNCQGSSSPSRGFDVGATPAKMIPSTVPPRVNSSGRIRSSKSVKMRSIMMAANTHAFSAATLGPQDMSFENMAAHTHAVGEVFRKNPEIQDVGVFVPGMMGVNSGVVFAHMKPRDQRPHSVDEIIDALRPKL